MVRLGLLLDGFTVPAWVARAVTEAETSGRAEIALVVLRGEPAPGAEVPRAAKLWQRRHHLLWELYARLDKRWMTPDPDPFARVDLEPLLGRRPRLEVAPETTRFTDTFPAEDVAAVRAADLDVLLRFGFRILHGEILDAARHGIWSYHHDDPRRIRGGPPGFWELAEGHDVTGAALQVLNERLDGGRVIYRALSPTRRRSLVRNRSHVYWKSATFVGRCLDALERNGSPEAGLAVTEGVSPVPYDGPLYRKPDNRRTAAFLGRLAVRGGSEALADRLGRSHWTIAWRFGEPGAPPGREELRRFERLAPPPDRFWADPFPWYGGIGSPPDGSAPWHLFFEEYRHGERRGHLRVLELDPARGAGTSAQVLRESFHLSHPFLFRHRGELFLLPETARARQLRLYRCRRFPDEWTLEAVLMDDVYAVDATLHREPDRWWMFVNLAPYGAAHAHDELCLFHSASPLGPWRPMPGNPILPDARRARPAGRLFRHRGELYRPAQDCSRRYGWAITLHRVRRLATDGYEEVPVGRIEPRWLPGLLATHTYNRSDDDSPGASLTVVDGMRRIPRWRRGRA